LAVRVPVVEPPVHRLRVDARQASGHPTGGPQVDGRQSPKIYQQFYKIFRCR
jgi:hypothetical protein